MKKKNYPKAIEIFQLVQTEFHKYQQHNESCSIQWDSVYWHLWKLELAHTE